MATGYQLTTKIRILSRPSRILRFYHDDAVDTPQADESSNLEQQDLGDYAASLCATIQSEIPVVVEDILKFYDEIGRPTVRTRYLDNVRFEEALIKSRLRSNKESSRSQQVVSTTHDETASSTSLEDHFQVVSIEDADENEASAAEANNSLLDNNKQQAEGSHDSILPSESQGIIEEEILADQSEDAMPSHHPREIAVEESVSDRPLKLVDGAASLVSKYKTLSREVLSSIMLLRTLSNEEWIEFDHPKEDKSEDLIERTPDDVETDEITAEQSTQLTIDLESAQRLSTISELALENHSVLDADHYNIILARLAICPELLPNEIIARIMDVCESMKHCRLLDSTTYEIILLALDRRFAASPVAASFVLQVTPEVEWSPKMMEAAAALCQNRNNHDLAMKILKTMNSTSIFVPRRAYKYLLNYANMNDQREYALNVIEYAVDNTNGINDHALDTTLANSVRWRSRDKYGKVIDNRSFFLDIIRLLDRKSSTYRPGYPVWEALIDSMAIGAKHSPDRWKMIVQAFKSLGQERPRYSPSHKLLLHGLDASHALTLPDLACELVCRAMDTYVPRSGSADAPMISVMDVSRAMQLCAQTGEIGLCRRILSSSCKMGFHKAGLRNLFDLALSAAGKEGNVTDAEQILASLQQADIPPGCVIVFIVAGTNHSIRSKSYGALMNAYALSNDLAKATQLLEALESEDIEFGLLSTAIYDGYILACVRCDAWGNIKPAFDKMREFNAEQAPSLVATHGLLLACHRTQHEDSKQIVHALLCMKATLNEDAALIAARILIPQLCSSGPLSPASLWDTLGCVSVERHEHRYLASVLHRLLAVATLDSASVAKKTPEIWNDVVAAIVKLSDVPLVIDESSNRVVNFAK